MPIITTVKEFFLLTQQNEYHMHNLSCVDMLAIEDDGKIEVVAEEEGTSVPSPNPVQSVSEPPPIP